MGALFVTPGTCMILRASLQTFLKRYHFTFSLYYNIIPNNVWLFVSIVILDDLEWTHGQLCCCHSLTVDDQYNKRKKNETCKNWGQHVSISYSIDFQRAADEVYKEFNNQPFNSFEDSCCHLVFISRVECMKSSEVSLSNQFWHLCHCLSHSWGFCSPFKNAQMKLS